MTYPSHRSSREDSRGKERGYLKKNIQLCEYCNINKACSCHHIECSYHGNKKKNEQGFQLLAVCLSCHNKIHAKNNFNTRDNCKNIALLHCINKNDSIKMTSSK